MDKKKAVVLLSGGMDSATTLFWAKKRGFDCLCLTFDYGQRHCREIDAAKKIARIAGCSSKVIKLKFPWKGDALTDKNVPLPRGRLSSKFRNVPSTYVPARNTVFLSIALSCAESIRAKAILIGANAVDFSGYPDCRPDYYAAFRKMARLGTKCGIQGKPIAILAPLIKLSKAQIVRLAGKLRVPLDLTWSCYAGGKKPCGKCDACLLRDKGFREAGDIP